jgi:hypothetical protein
MLELVGGGGNLPIGSLHAFATDGRSIYTDNSGAIWLQVGIVETDLGVYPLAPITRADIGNTFADPFSNGIDLAWDGTNFWVLSDATNLVYKLDSAGTDTGFSFDSSLASGAKDIIWDGTNLVVTTATNSGLIRKFNTAGTHVGTLDVSSQLTNPLSTTWDGTHYYVRSGTTNSSIYKYTAADAFVEEIPSVSGVGFKGTEFDGTDFWVQYTNKIQKYNTSWELIGGITYPLLGNEQGFCIKDNEFYYIDITADLIRRLEIVSGQAYGDAQSSTDGATNYIRVA